VKWLNPHTVKGGVKLDWNEIAMRIVATLAVVGITGAVGFVGHQVAFVYCQTKKNTKHINILFAKLREKETGNAAARCDSERS